MKRGLKIGVVGLRFGGSFPGIYREHPLVSHVVVCDANRETLEGYAARHGFDDATTRFEDLLSDPELDAIHIVTGIPTHTDLTLQALKAGKHTACTVPMATTLEDLKAIVREAQRSGRNYMMLETAVYTYQLLMAKEMVQRGDLGRIQFLRGAHYQDMENWPPYWAGLPPMWYATHAVAPLLELAGSRATRVHCFGSGTMRPELEQQYGCPYPIETAIFQLESPGLAAEVTRSLFHTAHEYIESFHVLGEKASVEWHRENDLPIVTTMKPSANGLTNDICSAPASLRDYQERLPESIRKYTRLVEVPDPANPHQSIRQGGGHHGSHPHLVHEFLLSIVEQRKPAIDAVTAANWTAAGICAHQSAMAGGAAVEIPDFAFA